MSAGAVAWEYACCKCVPEPPPPACDYCGITDPTNPHYPTQVVLNATDAYWLHPGINVWISAGNPGPSIVPCGTKFNFPLTACTKQPPPTCGWLSAIFPKNQFPLFSKTVFAAGQNRLFEFWFQSIFVASGAPDASLCPPSAGGFGGNTLIAFASISVMWSVTPAPSNPLQVQLTNPQGSAPFGVQPGVGAIPFGPTAVRCCGQPTNIGTAPVSNPDPLLASYTQIETAQGGFGGNTIFYGYNFGPPLGYPVPPPGKYFANSWPSGGCAQTTFPAVFLKVI